MLMFNKKKRIQYLGFNDNWFTIIGMIMLSFITDFLFSKSFFRYPLLEAILSWSVSLFFTICNWLIIRSILIGLRKRFPDFKDDKKRVIIFLLSIISTVVFVDFFGGKLLMFIINSLGANASHSQQLKVLIPVTIITIMIMAIYEAIYYYIRLKKSIREEEQTKQIMIQAQLDTLRNQAQPHFLFNSLNTLRDIIDEEAKEDAKKFVDKLSDVYRFILESGNSNVIVLQKEVKFVKSYIHIQLERFGDNLKVDWNVSDDSLGLLIVPMSLQLLIENAIKHNVVSRAKPLLIKVETTDKGLVVSNKIQPKSTKVPSTKIGLKNIAKRYALICNQPLDIKDNNEYFTVTIPLLKTSNPKK